MVLSRHKPYVHEMQVLDREKGLELLLKKAFVDRSLQDFEGVAHEIVDKCSGLPLTITIVGGLLVYNNPSKSKWQRVLRDINLYLRPRSEGIRSEGSNIFAIVELSFFNLPPLLKPCFMCLSFFREDTKIRLKRLVHIWNVLGLFPQAIGGETVESIGAFYFNELVNRHLVLIEKLTKDGSVKTFKMHDLIRDLSIMKAKKEMRFDIYRPDRKSECLDSPRHRVVFCVDGGVEKFNHSEHQNKHIRSLFFQGYNYNQIDMRQSYWKSFQLLQLLDFEGFKMTDVPDAVGLLMELKYLGLRSTNTYTISNQALAHLKKLEVLDLSHNMAMELPNSVCGLDMLRHLYTDLGSLVPLKIGSLKYLETLGSVNLEDGTLEKLTHMNNLRKLGMVILENSPGLWTSLARLENLECLNLRFDGLCSFDGLGMLQNLTHLKLRLEDQREVSNFPSAHDFPPKLSSLTLTFACIEPDKVNELAKLPELVHLKLILAYRREELLIPAYGFPKLKVLWLLWMRDLRVLQVEQGGLPVLERLEIDACPNLSASNIPEELRPVTIILDETNVPNEQHQEHVEVGQSSA